MGVIRRQGIKNTISGYLGMLIGFLNLAIVQPYFLTKEELGLTRILFSFSLLVAMFVPIGITNATTKYFPMFKDEKKGHHGFLSFINLFPMIGFVVATAIIWILKDFIKNQYRTESPLVLEYFNYVFPLIFFLSFISVLTVYCNANYKSTIPSFANDVLVRVLTIVVVSIYHLKWVTLHQFVLIFILIYAIQLSILVFYLFSFEKPVFKIDWKIFREKKFFSLIKFGMLLWFAGVASIGLKYFDSLFIGKYMVLDFVGIYTVATFMTTVIDAPLVAFEKIAAAKISFAWSLGDKAQIESIYRQSSLYMFLIGGFLFLNVVANIHTLLTFLPEGYQQGEIVVVIIGMSTLFNMATGLSTPILFNSDKYRYGAFYLILLSVLIIGFLMFLIPRFGLTGAAIATASSSFIYNSLLFISIYKFFGFQPFTKRNLNVLLIVVFVFAGIYLLPHFFNRYLDIALRAFLVSAVYLSFVYFFKIVPELHRHLPWIKEKKVDE